MGGPPTGPPKPSQEISAGDYSCGQQCKPATHTGSRQVHIYGQYAQPVDGHLGSKLRPSPSCEHVREAGFQHSGVFYIGVGESVHKVWCELAIAGGGVRDEFP
jgi:hypothetical protein